MYDVNKKNQAVKECLNGRTRQETAAKFGVHMSTLNNWVIEYRKKMAQYVVKEEPVNGAVKKEATSSRINLRSMNIDIDGNQVTVTKDYLEKLLEIFKAFEE